MRDPGHFYGKYKLSWISHAILGRKNINGVIKNFLIKNSFPKNKEKKFINHFNACEAINAFSKIFIYGPTVYPILSKYRTSKTQKFFLFSFLPILYANTILSSNTISPPSIRGPRSSTRARARGTRRCA